MKSWPFPSHSYEFEYHDILVNKIRTVSPKNLSLPFVSYQSGSPKKDYYPVEEIITDYITDTKPFNALMDALQRSNCPYVATIRESIAQTFAERHADEMEEFKRDH